MTDKRKDLFKYYGPHVSEALLKYILILENRVLILEGKGPISYDDALNNVNTEIAKLVPYTPDDFSKKAKPEGG